MLFPKCPDERGPQQSRGGQGLCLHQHPHRTPVRSSQGQLQLHTCLGCGQVPPLNEKGNPRATGTPSSGLQSTQSSPVTIRCFLSLSESQTQPAGARDPQKDGPKDERSWLPLDEALVRKTEAPRNAQKSLAIFRNGSL